MGEKVQWHGFSWTIGANGKCPECGKATLCWRHLYMAEKYAKILQGLKGEVGLIKDSEYEKSK